MTDMALSAQPDSTLCSLAAAGSEAAFEALVERYRRPLISYCRRMLWADGEDVVQDAFLNAWCSLRAGTEVQHTKAWLYRIVRNQALNRVRRGDGDVEPLPDSLAGADGAEFQVERCLAARDTLAAVAGLPELQREAILMTAVHGASYEQTAESLGISDDTVRGLVYRARASLRSAFAAVTPSPLLAWVVQQDISTAATPVVGVVGSGNAFKLLRGIAVLASTANLVAGSLSGIGAHTTVSHANVRSTHSQARATVSARRSLRTASGSSAPIHGVPVRGTPASGAPGASALQLRSSAPALRTGLALQTRSAKALMPAALTTRTGSPRAATVRASAPLKRATLDGTRLGSPAPTSGDSTPSAAQSTSGTAVPSSTSTTTAGASSTAAPSTSASTTSGSTQASAPNTTANPSTTQGQSQSSGEATQTSSQATPTAAAPSTGSAPASAAPTASAQSSPTGTTAPTTSTATPSS